MLYLLLFSRSVVSNSLWPHGLQHARLPCASLPRVCSNSCPLSQWCHPTISSSVFPFSPCPLSFAASRSLPINRLFASGGQSTGTSASDQSFQWIFNWSLGGCFPVRSYWSLLHACLAPPLKILLISVFFMFTLSNIFFIWLRGLQNSEIGVLFLW